jgi:Mlc titration factor MtfA (ptsG expression regulator)
MNKTFECFYTIVYPEYLQTLQSFKKAPFLSYLLAYSKDIDVFYSELLIVSILSLIFIGSVALYINFVKLPWYFYGDLFIYFSNKFNLKKLKTELPAHRRRFLSQIPFYARLNPDNKLVFERRTQFFILQKEFIARGGLKEVTDEMKTLIGGHAIMITWGHPSIYLSGFEKILIYPDSYYSTIRQTYHQGEVNIRGLIVFSLSNMQRGLQNNSDGVNLIIHELAHALHIINKRRIKPQQEYSRFMQTWIKDDVRKQYYAIKKMSDSNLYVLLRKSAFINFYEFFAVSLESFFEQPENLRLVHPKLYFLLAKLLRLNPIKPEIKFEKKALQ